jgi:CubicO group peptidase (beta-lactamase class C family)
MAKVEGHCDPKFEKVRALFQEFIETGEENGASIVANIDGKIVIDMWGGYADEDKKKPWEKDTIVNVWSSTKTIAALAVLVCADRGLLTVDDKVAKHWPEFAENEKENIEIRHLLSHTAGLSAWDPPFTIEDLYDLEKSTTLLAKQKPWWEPGTQSGYHALSMGHLLGEVVRRVTGKSLKQFVDEEIAGPVGADFQIGAKEKDWDRIATLTPPPPPPPPETPHDMESVAMKTFMNPAPNALTALTPEWRNAEIGAANGHGNARSLNRIMSNIPLGGSVGGHKFISKPVIDRIFDVQSDGQDLALPIKVRFGIGYGIAQEENLFGIPTDGGKNRVCYWAGWGGSIVMMDVDRKSTFTYAMNKMAGGTTGSPRTLGYLKAYYDALVD